MKRFIRLKNGEIYDTKRIIPILVDGDIIAENDKLFDLLQDDDLVELYGNVWPFKSVRDCIKFHSWNITKIYTKQGDDFVPVWNKERGVI